jgi:hypothetical protein
MAPEPHDHDDTLLRADLERALMKHVDAEHILIQARGQQVPAAPDDMATEEVIPRPQSQRKVEGAARVLPGEASAAPDGAMDVEANPPSLLKGEAPATSFAAAVEEIVRPLPPLLGGTAVSASEEAHAASPATVNPLPAVEATAGPPPPAEVAANLPLYGNVMVEHVVGEDGHPYDLFWNLLPNERTTADYAHAVIPLTTRGRAESHSASLPEAVPLEEEAISLDEMADFGASCESSSEYDPFDPPAADAALPLDPPAADAALTSVADAALTSATDEPSPLASKEEETKDEARRH